MLLVLTTLPTAPDATTRLGERLQLPELDVTRRLAGTAPRVLLSDPSADRIKSLAEVLRRDGFAATTCDPADVPSDRQRVVGHRLERLTDGFAVLDRAGQRVVCPSLAISLFQVGLRTPSGPDWLPSIDLLPPSARDLTRGRRTRRVPRAPERFVVVQRMDGQPDVILYETRLHYGFLGEEMTPVSLANFRRTVQWLRGLAPTVRIDNRVTQRSFIESLPITASDPVDLALYLVRLAATLRLTPYRT